MQFQRGKACNYSAHVFQPILFGVCAGIIISYPNIVENVRKNHIQKIRGEWTALSESSCLRIGRRTVSRVSDTKFGIRIERKSGIPKQRRNTKMNKCSFNGFKSNGVKSFRPIKKEEVERVLLCFKSFEHSTHVDGLAC